MFTVTVGREASGNSSTRAPFARRYSVTPSTVAIFRGTLSARDAETQSSTIKSGVNRDRSMRTSQSQGAKTRSAYPAGRPLQGVFELSLLMRIRYHQVELLTRRHF